MKRKDGKGKGRGEEGKEEDGTVKPPRAKILVTALPPLQKRAFLLAKVSKNTRFQR